MRMRIIVFPKTVKPCGVLLTISPVTQVAEVAVNRASTKEMGFVLGVETGSISRAVPVRIVKAKLKTRATAGLFPKEKIISKFYNNEKINTRSLIC
jgi:hypothetical protein